ncbi:hypothetical protein [Litoribaculum gwangyangense]|uniref:Uncharacterized protein n=1 Tax=Litoribaculum gwangyangense TaxID=1130722 RepID=A0ABP9CS35_9FLAO
MIKFFRKIRQRLVFENRFNKYLLYAIGEIILVVIGILIALQLNIRREDSKETKAAEKLLIGVQTDLKLEAERIDFLVAYYSKITDGIQQIILNYQEKENNSNKELGKFFLNTLEIRKFSKFNTNYQTLYGSGLLQEIEEKKLSEEIITYYSKQFLEWSLEVYQQKAGAFNFNNNALFNPLDKLKSDESYHSIPNFRLDIRTDFSTNFKEFIKEPDVLNFLADLLHQSELVFNNLKAYKESNLYLSNRIEKYLNK